MLSAYCMNCLLGRQILTVEHFDDEYKKAEFMKEVLNIVATMEEGEAAPVAVSKINKVYKRIFNESFSFEALKDKYNRLMLTKEDEIMSNIYASEDRLLTALKYARVGNYIDFGALKSVEDETLNKLIANAPSENIDMAEYSRFKADIESADSMVYLPDNCGEIVFDKALIRIITELYPNLDLTVIVRGESVLNDTTVADAHLVGIDTYARVMGNGTGIPGTFLPKIPEDIKGIIVSADLILAKGQGNFETLFGSGLNVYYAFLAKCEWFQRRFGMKPLEGVFTNENRQTKTSGGVCL